MAFSVGKKKEGSTLVLEVKGNVDEDANFTPPDLGGATSVTLDLEGVTAINSVGIREWIKWVKTMPASLKLSVRKCPKIIVDQINMVAGFLPQEQQSIPFMFLTIATARAMKRWFYSATELSLKALNYSPWRDKG